MPDSMEIDPTVLRQLAEQHRQVARDTREWAKPPADWLASFLATYGKIASPVYDALIRYYDARQRAGEALALEHDQTAESLVASANAYQEYDDEIAANVKQGWESGGGGSGSTPLGQQPGGDSDMGGGAGPVKPHGSAFGGILSHRDGPPVPVESGPVVPGSVTPGPEAPLPAAANAGEPGSSQQPGVGAPRGGVIDPPAASAGPAEASVGTGVPRPQLHHLPPVRRLRPPIRPPVRRQSLSAGRRFTHRWTIVLRRRPRILRTAHRR